VAILLGKEPSSKCSDLDGHTPMESSRRVDRRVDPDDVTSITPRGVFLRRGHNHEGGLERRTDETIVVRHDALEVIADLHGGRQM